MTTTAAMRTYVAEAVVDAVETAETESGGGTGASSPVPTGILRSGIAIGAATTLASGANYLSNVLLGRGLSPREFADSALIVSSLLMLSAMALGFQLVTARAVASGASAGTVARYRRNAAFAGIAVAVTIVLGGPMIASTVNMASMRPLVALAVGVPVYLVMAVGRGVAQSNGAFGRLAVSIAIEAAARLLVTGVGVEAGWGATGAAIALTASFAVAFFPCRSLRITSVGSASGGGSTRSGRATAATVMLLTGQVMVSNGDLWVVAAIVPDRAGTYAAVALIGRLVFVAAWSVVTVVFPSLVSDDATQRSVSPLLFRAVAVTVAFGGIMTLGARWGGVRLISSLLGPGYEDGGALLWPYALATTLFVISNLLAVADVGAGRLTGPAVVLLAGVTQTIVLISGAATGIDWVVWAQVWVMAGLLAALILVRVVPGCRQRHPTIVMIWSSGLRSRSGTTQPCSG